MSLFARLVRSSSSASSSGPGRTTGPRRLNSPGAETCGAGRDMREVPPPPRPGAESTVHMCESACCVCHGVCWGQVGVGRVVVIPERPHDPQRLPLLLPRLQPEVWLDGRIRTFFLHARFLLLLPPPLLAVARCQPQSPRSAAPGPPHRIRNRRRPPTRLVDSQSGGGLPAQVLPLVLVLVPLTAWARVAVGRHYPLDTLAGVFVGAAAGYVLEVYLSHSAR